MSVVACSLVLLLLSIWSLPLPGCVAVGDQNRGRTKSSLAALASDLLYIPT